jgi:hypothetical protein
MAVCGGDAEVARCNGNWPVLVYGWCDGGAEWRCEVIWQEWRGGSCTVQWRNEGEKGRK